MKTLYGIIKFLALWVELLGLGLVAILSVHSIVWLKTNQLDNLKWDLSPFFTSKTMAWTWIIIFVAYIANRIVKISVDIKKGWKQLKNDKGEITFGNVLKWFIKN
jgi:type III secretory pathway component EscU